MELRQVLTALLAGMSMGEFIFDLCNFFSPQYFEDWEEAVGAWDSSKSCRVGEASSKSFHPPTNQCIPAENAVRNGNHSLYLATVAAHAKHHWGLEFTSVEPLND